MRPVFDAARIEFEVVKTNSAHHASQLLDSVPMDDLDGVIAVGGDGIFNQVTRQREQGCDFAIITPFRSSTP